MSGGFAGLSVWRALILLVRFPRTPLASLVLGEETWTLFHPCGSLKNVFAGHGAGPAGDFVSSWCHSPAGSALLPSVWRTLNISTEVLI